MARRISSTPEICFLLVTALGIGACGGGGGGGGGGTSPPPPPPPVDDTTFGTLAITSDNADVLALGLSLSEGTLAFAQTAINRLIEYAGDGVTQLACGNTGMISIVHRDLDSSFDVSAGDEISLTFTDCYERIVDGVANGVLDIAVTSFSLDSSAAAAAGDLLTNGPFTLTDPVDPSIVVRVTADLAFDFVLQVPEVLTVTASGAQRFAADFDGIVETISEFTIRKSATRNAPGSSAANVDTDTTIDIFYDSDVYGGTFSCGSDTIGFTGGSDLPDSAAMTCNGRNRSGVRVVNLNEVGVDPEGDGTYTELGILDWNAVLDGFIKTDSGLVLDELRGDVSLRRLGIQNNDVTVDAARGRLLVATSSLDGTYPNTLLSIDPGANAVSPLVTFQNEPNRVRVSEFDALIYVSFTERGEIRRFDADTLAEQPALEVQSDETISSEYGVIDLEVSPLGAGRIAVAFQFLGTGETDISIFDGEIQAPVSYRDAASGSPTSFDSIEFSGDGARLFAGRTSSTASGMLDLDANGVVSATRLVETFFAGVKRYGDRLLGGNRVFDGETLVKVGTYESNPWASAIDTLNNLALVLGQGEITAFRRDTFVPLATYDLGLDDPDRIRDIVTIDDTAVLIEDSTLHLLSIADIAVQNTDECEVVGLTTDENEPYTNYACPIEDAVYDPLRDKIYAATTSFLGVNGNAIAVIDHSSGLVEQYVHIGSDPRFLEMSADGNRLHAIFGGADTIATLDLNSLTLSRVQQIALTPPDSDPAALEPRRALRIEASSVEPDTFVVSLGRSLAGQFERLTAFRNGERLADDVSRAELQDSFTNKGPFVAFDVTGQPFALNEDTPANVQTLSLGPTGLSAGGFFEVGDVLIGEAKPDVAQDEVFTSMGGLIDLTAETGEARYDPDAPSFSDSRGGRAVNADVAMNDVWIFVGAGSGSGIARYTYDTGALTAEQFLELPPGPFDGTSLFDVGTDRLGVVANTISGLVVIDKAAIQ